MGRAEDYRNEMTAKAHTLQKEWRAKPEVFFEKVLGIRPYDQQVEIAHSVRDNKKTFVPSYHGGGKTYISAAIAIWYFMGHTPSKVITTAPTWLQVKALLWREIRQMMTQSKLPLGVMPDISKAEMAEDWYMMGISPKIEKGETDQGVRVQGFHSPNLLLILDEGPGVSKTVWDVIDSLMTGGVPRLLAIGNPVAAAGPFFNECRKRTGKVIKMDIWHNPNFRENGIHCLADLKLADQEGRIAAMPLPYPELTSPSWAADMMRKWGVDSPFFKSRVLSEFPVQGKDELIALAWVEACANPELDVSNATKKVLAIDVARFGNCETVMIGYHHWKQIFKSKHQGQDTVETAGRAKRAIQTLGIERVVVDDDGVGGGVTDQLTAWAQHHNPNLEVVPFRGGSSPEDGDNFRNLRDETYWKLRELARKREIHIEANDDMQGQLTALKYRFDDRQRIKIESKDEMAKRGLPSPDEADALMMAVHGMTTAGAATLLEEVQTRGLAGRELETSRQAW